MNLADDRSVEAEDLERFQDLLERAALFLGRCAQDAEPEESVDPGELIRALRSLSVAARTGPHVEPEPRTPGLAGR